MIEKQQLNPADDVEGHARMRAYVERDETADDVEGHATKSGRADAERDETGRR